MELVVVIALIGVMMATSLPRIRTAVAEDTDRRAINAMTAILDDLRVQAVRRHTPLFFQVMPDGKSYKAGDLAGEGEATPLPDSLQIQAMRRAGSALPETDRIGFYPAGHADPVFLWMMASSGKKTLVVPPLLPRVDRKDGFVIPEGWDHE